MYTETEKHQLAHDLTKWSDFELLKAVKVLTDKRQWEPGKLVQNEINRRREVHLQNDTAA